ncbi:carboxylate-amine ligase [Pseudomonas sp. CM25]|uniref:carboxylate-amine ligase n=1 Tax=Pseudomonas sp. CM25 TaxID=2738448 RepID=UPI001555448C|nr:carboxylate-amine ligase [Pseudomonas sp. CM25]NQD56919.1 carboxylate-amine ligase [Pseudomonas sp. CM25]HEN8800200.1 carboxylate-amine ligase [Pseudomonas putida]
MARSCTFGIEEEYLLIDLATGRVPVTPALGVTKRCRDALGKHFAQEMFRSQIEVASPVFGNLDQAREFFAQGRQRLAAAVAQEGMGLYGAASHPFAQWHRQKPAASAHYRQLFDDYQHVARRSLLNGLHVHVGVPAECDRMQLINRLVPWLPLLLVLSTSSPLWTGQHTGYMSYRRVICAEWPHMGLPEPLPDWPAYESYRALLQRTGVLAEDGDFWWAIRPSRRYPTVELRICDACPDLEDALCIAGLFRHLVEHNLDPGLDRAPPARELRWVAQENYWRAMRHGRHGSFIGQQQQQAVSSRGWLAQLHEAFPVDTADAERSLLHARRLLDAGTSADRQLACFERARANGATAHQALRRVVEQVVEEGGKQRPHDTAALAIAEG